MDVGIMGHIFLREAPQSPQGAYVSSESCLVVVHVPIDVTLSTLRL